MKQIIIFLAVLAPFLPELGGQADIGQLGNSGTADRALLPAFLALFLFARTLPATPIERFARPLLIFLAVAFVASISVPLRFPTASAGVAVMGVLRLCKFAGYAGLALASLRLFASPTYRMTVIAGWCVGVVLLAGTLVNQALILDAGQSRDRAGVAVLGNATSVALACTTVSSLVLLFSDRLSRNQTLLLGGITFIGVVGMVFSQGRGGWVSLLLGAAFMTRRIRVRYVVVAAALALVVVAAASTSTSVQLNLNRMIVSEEGYSASGDDADASLDDGARIKTWVHESAKLAAHPLLGFGIFHRGGASSLWSTGSHNFFLQMFLESGLLGGTAFLAFLWSLWRGTQSLSGQAKVGAQAVLITMLSGGLGGEYFYGDAPLYCLFISLWMLALPPSMLAWDAVQPMPGDRRRRRAGQPLRSRSVNSARSGIPSAASASAPPSPRSTTQSAPST